MERFLFYAFILLQMVILNSGAALVDWVLENKIGYHLQLTLNHESP